MSYPRIWPLSWAWWPLTMSGESATEHQGETSQGLFGGSNWSDEDGSSWVKLGDGKIVISW